MKIIQENRNGKSNAKMKKTKPAPKTTNNNKRNNNDSSFAEHLENYLKPREIFSIDDGKNTLVVDCFKYTAAYIRKRNLHLQQLQVVNRRDTNNNNNLMMMMPLNQDAAGENNDKSNTSSSGLSNRNLGAVAPLLDLDESNSQITTRSEDDDDSRISITVTRKKNRTTNDDDDNSEQQQQNNNRENQNNQGKLSAEDSSTSTTTFFLSHFHSDHYDGLHDGFKAGNIFCSPITAALVRHRWPEIYRRRLLNILELDQYYRIDLRTGKFCDRGHPPLRTRPLDRHEVDVICVDANHCPGAVMFVFHSLIHGVVVHTGDFRYNGESPPIEHEALMAVRKSNQEILESQRNSTGGSNQTQQNHQQEDGSSTEQQQQIKIKEEAQSIKEEEGSGKKKKTSSSFVNAFSMMMNPNRNAEMFGNSKKSNSARIAPGLGPSVKRSNTTSLTLPILTSNNSNSNSQSIQRVPFIHQIQQQQNNPFNPTQQQGTAIRMLPLGSGSSSPTTQKTNFNNSDSNNNNKFHYYNNATTLSPEQRERQLNEKLLSTLPKHFPLIDKPNKRVGDASALQTVKGHVAILFLDNTFCDPKYVFSPQPQILNEACVDVGKRIGAVVVKELARCERENPPSVDDDDEDSAKTCDKNNNNNNNNNNTSFRYHNDDDDDDDDLLAHIDNMVKRNDDGDKSEESIASNRPLLSTSSLMMNRTKRNNMNIIRIAICVGAYAIGKERVVLSLHSAFGEKLKFFVAPNRAELLKRCQMPILDAASRKKKNANSDDENSNNNNNMMMMMDLNNHHDNQNETSAKNNSSKQKSEAVFLELDKDQDFYPPEEASHRLETQKSRHEAFLQKYLRPAANNNNNNNNNNLHQALSWDSTSLRQVVDPSKVEVSLMKDNNNDSDTNLFWRTICEEFNIPLSNNNKNNNIDVRVSCFICDMSVFSYPSVSQSLTGNACFDTTKEQQDAAAAIVRFDTGNNENNNNNQNLSSSSQNKTDRTLSPAIFPVNDFFSLDLNDFDAVLSISPSGWANAGGRGRDSKCKQVTMIGVPYSEHSSYTQLLDFVRFLQPERIIPHVSVAQYKLREPEFLKQCKRLRIEHGSGVPLTRHFAAVAQKGQHKQQQQQHQQKQGDHTATKSVDVIDDVDDDDDIVVGSCSSSSLPQRRPRDGDTTSCGKPSNKNQNEVIELSSDDD